MSNAQKGILFLEENYPKGEDWRADIREKRPLKTGLDVSDAFNCPLALLSRNGQYGYGLRQFCPMPWNSWWWGRSRKAVYRDAWAVECGFQGDNLSKLTEEFRDAVYGLELDEAA